MVDDGGTTRTGGSSLTGSDLTDILSMAMDEMTDAVAVVDDRGDIVWVNQAWIAFGRDNGVGDDVDWVGWNYFAAACEPMTGDDEGATEIFEMLRDILDGARDEGCADYPCHAPDQQRWFQVVMSALDNRLGRFVTIAHGDVTDRHLAEERALQLAFSDPLTGVANRRHFDDFLDEQWRRAARFDQPIAVITVDVDNFKAMNDDHGHDVGDRVLGDLARSLESVCRRPSDLAARIGGDEFSAVLGGVDIDTAVMLARRVRAHLSARRSKRGAPAMTISIGVASARPHHGSSSVELVKAADEALMVAKRDGRDRIGRADVTASSDVDAWVSPLVESVPTSGAGGSGARVG